MKIFDILSGILVNKKYAIVGKNFVFTEKTYSIMKDSLPIHYVEFHKFHMSEFAFVSQKCPITTHSIKNFSSFYNERAILLKENNKNDFSYLLENKERNEGTDISFIPGRDSYCKSCENKFQCLYLDPEGIKKNSLTYKPFKKETLDIDYFIKKGFKQDGKLKEQVEYMINYD
jgi:hypothetical protein